MTKPIDDAALNQRLRDLVRYMRKELLDADLISKEEYADLVANTPDAVSRLEGYDRAVAAARAAGFAEGVAEAAGQVHEIAFTQADPLVIKERVIRRIRALSPGDGVVVPREMANQFKKALTTMADDLRSFRGELATERKAMLSDALEALEKVLR